MPPANSVEPAAITSPEPKRSIRRPASRNESSGTMSGPGTSETPVVSGDQCHTSCAHRTRDRSIAPKAIENRTATAEAPVNGRTLNSARSISGLLARAVCAANRASASTATSSTPMVRAEPQPQEPPCTNPSASAPTPPVISSAPSASGRRTGMAGDRGEKAPAGRERCQPDRHVDQEHPAPTRLDQHAADGGTQGGGHAAHGGPGPDRAVPALGREAGQDQPERGGGEQRRAGRLHDPEGDEHGQAGGRRARRRCGDEQRDADQEAAIAGVAVGQPAEQHEQRRVDDRVAVQDPGQAAEAVGAEVPGHLWERDVDDEQVEAGQHHAGADDHEDQVGGDGATSGESGAIAGERAGGLT